MRIDDDLIDRAVTRQPTPIADAVIALATAESAHERRDRVVEAFRVIVRYLGALGLASRLAHKPTDADSEALIQLISTLRSRSLTDGQWWHLLRELVKPWRANPKLHPIQSLVEMVRHPAVVRDIDALLGMRKSETVAHGTTGDANEVAEILAEREPILGRLLVALEPIHVAIRLAVTLPVTAEATQPALLLTGATPARGRHRRASLGTGERLPSDHCVGLDPNGHVLLVLDPVIRFASPSSGAIAEVFFLDGRTPRGGARYLSLPAASERTEPSIWERIDTAFAPPPTTSSGATGTRPYRGLARFERADAALFFGRDDEIQTLANRVRANGFVTLTGPSGSGKSSLLSAGLAAALELDDGATPFRDSSRRGAIVLFVRPGRDPLREIAGAIEANAPEPSAIANALRERAKDRLVVLVLDQAEELITLAPPDAALATATLLSELGGSASAITRVVLSVREDFFVQLASLAPLRALYDRQVMVLGPLDREALLRAIVEPARQFGVSFEPGVAESMVDGVVARPGALPLLQFAADRLWERRGGRRTLTAETYEENGGVAGALAAHAEELYAGLLPGQREAMRQVMLRLVTREGTRATASRSELASIIDAEIVLSRLVDGRLVVARQDADGAAVCEIIHEALIAHWPRLADWHKAEGDGAAHVAQLSDAARAWRRRDRARDLLWRGDVLAEHRRWLSRATLQLTTEEAEFIAASTARERGARRNRIVLVVAVAGALAAIAIVAIIEWRNAVEAGEIASRHANDAKVAAQRADRAAREARDRALIVRAHEYATTGHTSEEIAVLRALADPANGTTGRDLAVEEGLIWKAHQRLAIALGTDVSILARTRDGEKTIAVEPGAVVAWDVSGQEIARIAFDPKAGGLGRVPAISPTGRYVLMSRSQPGSSALLHPRNGGVISISDGVVAVRELVSGRELTTIAGPVTQQHVAFAPDDHAFAVRRGDRVEIWNAGESTVGRRIDVTGCNGALALGPDGKILVVGCERSMRAIRVIDGASSSLDVAATPISLEGRRVFAIDDRSLVRWGLGGSSERTTLSRTHQSSDAFMTSLEWTAGPVAAKLDDDPPVPVTGTGFGRGGMRGRRATVPEIRIGEATAIETPGSILAFAHEDDDGLLVSSSPWIVGWSRFSITNGDVPMRRPTACLPISSADHAVTSLDDGTRLLIDEQEISRAHAPRTRYRTPSNDEFPDRAIRAAVASDQRSCLVWETRSRGPGVDQAKPESASNVQMSVDRKYRADIEWKTNTVVISDHTGKELRRVPVSHDDATFDWAGSFLVVRDASNRAYPMDPAHAPLDLPANISTTEGHSPYVVAEDDRSWWSIRLADGASSPKRERTTYPSPQLIPDASGRTIAETYVFAFDAIAPTTQLLDTSYPNPIEVDPTGHWIRDQKSVWSLDDGKPRADNVDAIRTAFVGSEVWSIVDHRAPKLVRLNAGGHRTTTPLRFKGIPFARIPDGNGEFHVAPNGKWIAIRYEVVTEQYARAIFDAATGTPLWIGPDESLVIDGYVTIGNRSYVPDFDVEHIMTNTGSRTNLRVCRDDLRVVPVTPWPAPDTIWATDAACTR